MGHGINMYLSIVIGIIVGIFCGFLNGILDFAPYMFKNPDTFDEEYKQKHWKPETTELVRNYLIGLSAVQDFTTNIVHDFTKAFCDNKGIKFKDIIHPLRLMITGKSAGAGMFETMEVLGRETCLKRIEQAIGKLR